MTDRQLVSPCVSICALDEEDICVGCFRTGGEISIWGLLSDDEKREVFRRIDQRMNGEPAPCVCAQGEKAMTTQIGSQEPVRPVVGLALGSGSARGWAHIGIIQALEEIGVQPQVVAGTSIGALVGGAYVTGTLNAFADWVESLTVKDVFGLLDISFSGGMVKGEKLFSFFQDHHENPEIETLDKKLVTVATDMKSGREVWITKGRMLDAARASCALPGLFSPVKMQGRWMLDGGLVNPVPVSAARAMGADVVIAVNLNAQLVGAHLSRDTRSQAEGEEGTAEERSIWQKMMDYFASGDGQDPGFFDVVASSINIMQDRITRSRMAGDPPEVTLVPMLEDFALMDFHRAKEAIAEGRALVKRYEPIFSPGLGRRSRIGFENS